MVNSSTMAPESPYPVLQVAQPSTPAPISEAQRARNLRFATRMWCGFMTVLSGGMLGVGLYLQPSPNGLGTHTQLHLPPCGFYVFTGFPCPMCGCTTAVTHVAHGQFIAGIVTQPFGAAVGFLALILVVLGPIGVITGKWLGPEPFTLSFYWQRILFGSIGFLLAAWIYKIIVMHYSGI
jgi:hypothetical protein